MSDSVVMGSGSLNSRSHSGSSKTSTSPTENYQLARRRTLQVVVSSLLTECGFEQTYITEAGRCAKATCEHTARTVHRWPMLFCVSRAAPMRCLLSPSPPHSNYPDVSDYQVVREKAESQRRDVERALTRFMAKTGETESLFKDDISAFPLIAAKPSTIPYLSALLPSELELQTLEETDSSEQDDQTDTENNSSNVSQAKKRSLFILKHCLKRTR
uniref:TAF8 RNA polymerase II, TATA box binding protein (TBP)-associated factor n=1 Tax=Cyprinus carpio TaxID=7962 RepID=A0A8C1YHH3_CYPCA